MKAIGQDLISASDKPAFFRVGNAAALGISAPDNRLGDGLRTAVRSLSGFQKEALISSAKTGETWRFVSDEGPYLNGHDAACCPLVAPESSLPSFADRRCPMHCPINSARRPAVWIRFERSFRRPISTTFAVSFAAFSGGGTLARTCLSIVAIGVSAEKGGRASSIS